MFFFRVDWHLDTFFLQIWVVSSLGYFSWILWGSGTHNIYRLKQVIQVYQQQENYTIKFLLVTMKLPRPHLRAHPRGFVIFFFLGGLFPTPGTQKETIPHPWVPDQPHTFFATSFWSVQKQNDLFLQLLWTLSWVYWEKDSGCHNVVNTWTINLKTNYLWRRKTLKNVSLIEH